MERNAKVSISYISFYNKISLNSCNKVLYIGITLTPPWNLELVVLASLFFLSSVVVILPELPPMLLLVLNPVSILVIVSLRFLLLLILIPTFIIVVVSVLGNGEDQERNHEGRNAAQIPKDLYESN